MTFVGIDLAADPKNTGIAILREDSGCVVDHVRVGVEDDDIVEAIRTAGLAGVDVPLGWPVSTSRWAGRSGSSSSSPPMLPEPCLPRPPPVPSGGEAMRCVPPMQKFIAVRD
ncbi:hypothetical protein [Garicola koreensis]|uniref:DUF429 domain-containing protein n=1 Tax=Garicola koreensis TaxID=1262554 RepID=A0A7W5TNJ7_9MICC|nr:hypothetical protein [Garicola koreensis]